MKIVMAFLLGVLLASTVAVSYAVDVPGRAQAWAALQSSVVLVGSAEGRAFCGGTKVGERLVLTAFHCVRFYDEKKPLMVRAFADQARLIETRIVWTRNGADLALLQSSEPIPGRIAPLVTDLAVGDTLVLIGAPQTSGIVADFMATRGMVGLIRVMAFVKCDGSPEPFGGERHQVILSDVSAYFGNSGGGAFNREGQLVGVLVRGEAAEPDNYVCSDTATYKGESHLWSYIVGFEELRKIPKPVE